MQLGTDCNSTNVHNKETFISQIENIHPDDLPYLEKDLSFSEKVSLVFLLFGNTKTNTFFGLQKLLALYKNQNLISDVLFTYSRTNKINWKLCLVEALAIIRAHRVLRKLGISRFEYEITFLPYTAETSLYIHPILKALYFVCENLNLSEAETLILDVRKETSQSYFFTDPSFLEIFLLEYITSSIITIGDWPECINGKVNLKVIISFLKRFEKDSLKNIIESTSKYINNKIERKQNDYVISRIETKNEVEITPGPSELKNDAPTNTLIHGVDAFNKINSYKINRASAGYVLIINQHKFYEDEDPNLQHLLPTPCLPCRKGTEKDKISLKDTFTKYGYKIHIKDDLTHIQIKETVRNMAKISRYYDSLIVCILSHGLEGVFYGSNSIPVQVSEIESILASSKELYKIPKILIIQACQGTKMQQANTCELDSPFQLNSSIEELTIHNVSKQQQSVSGDIQIDEKHFGDILKIVSTVQGYASIRDINSGSWFIQTLCKNINLFGNRMHLQEIITTVIGEVSEKTITHYGNNDQKNSLCVIPQYHSTLGKNFWLPSS